MPLDIGDTIPELTLPASGGGDLSLADYRGRKLVLYFYPKDNTSGCSAEACDFRDLMSDFEKSGAEVIGVSKDSVRRHDNFIAKYDLPFGLISDADGTLCELFGVWQEKKLYGKTHMGIERSTFLIDADGVIREAWRKVRVKDHAKAVLAATQEL
ncbi:MAG TPA: thioredoxin-dependent thiol peroxidase [Rhodospirillaceae bacterium]|mgnify:CR=1 FL=1|nr:thioredoxin-dependent thiol peroxidase [Rhodospirillaceae bacterium]HAA92543.1 thioredoxin-dependent thiol peroxidase [Rhodospirillaceae bacterium]HAT36362.1 thioredoxin-dependent thiol peroxidase [Rhodospirillaceae bacterium]|tara:strand:- start:383 stop:847 length:465 start_codon:yes stop_codon:yes gene_type:complete